MQNFLLQKSHVVITAFTSPFHVSAKKFYSTDLNKHKQSKDLDDDDDEWKDKV